MKHTTPPSNVRTDESNNGEIISVVLAAVRGSSASDPEGASVEGGVGMDLTLHKNASLILKPHSSQKPDAVGSNFIRELLAAHGAIFAVLGHDASAHTEGIHIEGKLFSVIESQKQTVITMDTRERKRRRDRKGNGRRRRRQRRRGSVVRRGTWYHGKTCLSGFKR